MVIEPLLFYCVAIFMGAYVAALGYVIHMLQEENKHYRELADKHYDMWLKAMNKL